jgi:hypothetical protein
MLTRWVGARICGEHRQREDLWKKATSEGKQKAKKLKWRNMVEHGKNRF